MLACMHDDVVSSLPMQNMESALQQPSQRKLTAQEDGQSPAVGQSDAAAAAAPHMYVFSGHDSTIMPLLTGKTCMHSRERMRKCFPNGHVCACKYSQRALMSG